MNEVTIDGKTYPVHEAAKSFPMMTEEEFQELKQDIAKNGCRVPITIWDGQLLDGRNRLKACEELGIEPWTEELDTEHDPWAYVISHNLHRRHLSDTQREAVAAKLVKSKRGGDRGNQHTGGKVPNGTLAKDAAKQLNVSERSVKRAKLAIDNGCDELVQAMERDEITSSLAAELVKAVPDKAKQSEIIAKGAKKVREALKQTKLQLEVEPVAAASDEATRDAMLGKSKGLRMVSSAMGYARMAISQLERIQPDDPGKAEALNYFLKQLNEMQPKVCEPVEAAADQAIVGALRR